jgi:hypothetical protein
MNRCEQSQNRLRKKHSFHSSAIPSGNQKPSLHRPPSPTCDVRFVFAARVKSVPEGKLVWVECAKEPLPPTIPALSASWDNRGMVTLVCRLAFPKIAARCAYPCSSTKSACARQMEHSEPHARQDRVRSVLTRPAPRRMKPALTGACWTDIGCASSNHSRSIRSATWETYVTLTGYSIRWSLTWTFANTQLTR